MMERLVVYFCFVIKKRYEDNTKNNHPGCRGIGCLSFLYHDVDG
jgi:hypothetical protein